MLHGAVHQVRAQRGVGRDFGLRTLQPACQELQVRVQRGVGRDFDLCTLQPACQELLVLHGAVHQVRVQRGVGRDFGRVLDVQVHIR